MTQKSINTDLYTISEEFATRFKKYKVVDFSDFTGSVGSLFGSLCDVSFENGKVSAGVCGDEPHTKLPYLLIASKVGKIMLYKTRIGNIHYICENSVAVCHTWTRAGLGASGVIDNMEKFNHIFAIPDSYLQSA